MSFFHSKPPVKDCDEQCGVCDPCVFSYKSWEHEPADASVPLFTHLEGAPYSNLHVSNEGYVHFGGKVFNPDGTEKYTLPSPYDIEGLFTPSTFAWCWIEEDPVNGGMVNAYGVELAIGAAPGGEYGNNNLDRVVFKVWKYYEFDNTAEEFINETFVAQRNRVAIPQGVISGEFYYEWVDVNEGPIRITLDSLPSSKWGDVRFGVIAVVGTAAWINYTPHEAQFKHNDRVRIYDSTTGVKKNEDFLFDHPLDVEDEQDINFQYRPLRLRIGQDKGLYVLAEPQSKVPFTDDTQIGEMILDEDNVPTGAIPKYIPNPSALCFFKVTDDVTPATPVIEVNKDLRPRYGRWSGISNQLLRFWDGSITDPPVSGVTFDAPEIRILLKADRSGYIIHWGMDPTTGMPPFNYDLEVDGVVVATGITNQFEYLTDVTVATGFRLVVTDDTGDISTSRKWTVQLKEEPALFSRPRDFDVSPMGNAFIALLTHRGWGMVKIKLDPGTGATNTIGSDPDNGYMGWDYTEAAEYIYAEGTPEYAGPINSFTSMPVPAPPPPDESDGADVYVLRPGTNGTYLVKITLSNPNTTPYSVNRIWSCSYYPHLRMEAEPFTPAHTESEVEFPADGGVLHTTTDGSVVKESEAPCPPCDPPVDDPCGDCPDKTRRVAWELIDDVLKDDAYLAHSLTKFMQCQLLQGGIVNNVLVDGVITHNVPVHPDCEAHHELYVHVPPTFRPKEEEDCQWEFCGRRIKLCSPEYEAGDPPILYIFCFDSGISYATLGKELVGSEYKFRLKIWRQWIDLETGIEYGPEAFVIYETEDVEEICGPTATFHKILDLSEGEVDFVGGSPSYFGLPYFRDTVRARRATMDTPCDIPPPPPEPEWCPGDGTPPAKLWFDGVDPSPTTPAGHFECPSPEPYAPSCPGDLDYNGTNSYTGGNLTYVAQCATSGGYVEEETVISFSLDFDDIDDPLADAFINYNWTSQGNAGSGTVGFEWTCPPFAGESADIFIAICSDSGEVTHTIRIAIHRNEPSPAMPSRRGPAFPGNGTKRQPAQKKTPDDLPCKFRGGFLTVLDCCGRPEAYQCKCPEINAQKIRSCTINKNNRDDVASCSDCSYRSVPDSNN